MYRPAPANFFRVPNPHVPYLGDLPDRLIAGKKIFVSGNLRNNCTSFKINLETENGIALHFNPRMNQGCVVRNTCFFGSWGAEEVNGPMPFGSGLHFDVEIAVEPENFVIGVNGDRCFTFQHRVPFEEITHIAVDGDLELENIIFSTGHMPSQNYMPVSNATSVPDFKVPNPRSPYRGDIPHGQLVPGRKILINGKVRDGCKSFVVNLDTENGIAFHLNPRMGNRQNLVVRNSFFGNAWGNEDRDGPMPFSKGNHFELEIQVEPENYIVYVNGSRCFEFQHRVAPEEVTHLSIDGDVKIENIVFKSAPQKLYPHFPGRPEPSFGNGNLQFRPTPY